MIKFRTITALAEIGVFIFLAGFGKALAEKDEISPPPADSDSVVAQAQPLPTKIPYVYKIPQKLPDGWPVGDLRKEKVDAGPIVQGVADIRAGKIPDMHSLLIFRHGKLLLEEYFNGSKADSPQVLNSCTKSVFATLYGIAQDQGLLSLNEKISDLYPESAAKGWGKEEEGITVGSILSMTSGLDCSDAGDWRTSCSALMNQSKDWLGFCFTRSMAHPVGTFWMYNGCSLSLISNLIVQKSGMSFSDYAQKYLLGPLGIEGDTWVTGPGGVNRVDYGLAWKTRDWAKLGQLYLNKGSWKGKRIVSEAWIKDSTSLHCLPGTAWGHDYGYLWHLKNMKYKNGPVRVFYANGYQGQAIFVSPEADLICVMTAANMNDSIYSMEEGLFRETILTAFH
jgi:CubicO group peptidase (beta-lactamase class C family)